MQDPLTSSSRSGAIYVLTGATLLAALLFGGGTRSGFIGDAIVQYASLPLLMIAGFAVARAPAERGVRRVVLFCAALALIPLLQLVPLPPFLRGIFPGRQWIDSAYALMDRPVPFWPLSLVPHATWLAFLSLIPPLAVFFGTVALGYAQRRKLAMLILAVCVVSVFLGLLQISQGRESALRFFEFTNVDDAVGFFANRNHFAALLYSGTLLSAWWAVNGLVTKVPAVPNNAAATKANQSKALMGVAIALTMFAVLVIAQAMARSRAGLVLSMVALAAVLPLALSDPRSRAAPSQAAKMIYTVAAFAIVFSLQFALYRILSRFSPDAFGDTRLVFARTTLEAAKSFLPFGSGAGTFVWVFPLFETDASIGHFFANRAHNDIAEAALETGLPGIALMLVLLVWLVRTGISVWRGTGHPHAGDDDRALMKVAVVILALLAIHSFLDYPLHTCAMASFAAFCCGVLVPPVLRHGHHHRHHHEGHHHHHDAGHAPQRHAHARAEHAGTHKGARGPEGEGVDLRPVTPASAAGRAPRPHERWEGPVEWPQEWQKGGASKPGSGGKGPGSDEDQGK